METVKPELFTAVFENLLMSGQSFFFFYTNTYYGIAFMDKWTTSKL
jgi:hypothetical protein